MQFLIGRIVMALGGASFMTGARVMINLIKPGPGRFTGIKTFASGLAIANAAAPWLASVTVMHDRWNAIFGILIGLSLLACALGSICLPTGTVPEDKRTQSQPLTLVWLMGGSFLLLYALQRAYYEFYSNVTALIVTTVLAIASLIYFARSQIRHERPLLLVKELLQQRYVVVIVLFTICYFILGATNYMLPVLMQRALGFSWDVIGKIEALGLISALAGFWVIATILPKYPGPKKFYVFGFGALFVCGWILSGINSNANLFRNILPAIACYGLFIIFTMSTNAMQGFKDLQHNEVAFSHGQQVKNMLSQFGVGLGTSLATVGLQWRTTEHYSVLHERFVSGGVEFTRSIQQMSEYFSLTQGPQQAAQLATSQLAQQLSQQATLLAGIDYFWLLMIAGTVFAGIMGLQRALR